MNTILENVVLEVLKSELNVTEVKPKKDMAYESYINVRLNGKKTAQISINGFDRKYDNPGFVLLRLKPLNKIHVIDKYTSVQEIQNLVKGLK